MNKNHPLRTTRALVKELAKVRPALTVSDVATLMGVTDERVRQIAREERVHFAAAKAGRKFKTVEVADA